MGDVGYAAIILALAICVYAGVASFVGAKREHPGLMASGRNGAWAALGLLVLISGSLIYSLVTHDFGLRYVAEYSNRAQPMFYTIAAFWAGQQGSMLLWVLLLSIFTIVILLQNRRKNQALVPYVLSVMLICQAFFLLLIATQTNPFERSLIPPADGQGLNPLLQNPGMIAHPPTLYLGLVGFTVPFAFAIAALVAGKLDDDWLRSTRRWTLFAWFFLGAGNLLGAQWAYVELGWGGFWGWDPVENASLMPWLVGTAYLHSVMIQQRRGKLKVWNFALIILTFSLCVFGTFLTRSGVVSSVHSFAESGLGPFFLAFIGLELAASIGLLIARLPQLKSEGQLDSVLSRESTFLVNNLILVGAAVAVFIGTVFPIISQTFGGAQIALDASFFNSVTGPIFAFLILLMGICPLIGWRKASRENLIRHFLYPVIIAVVAAAALFVVGIQKPGALISYFLLTFVAFTILLQIGREIAGRHRLSGENYFSALVGLVRRNRPHYGGFVVHLSILLIGVAITGVFFYKYEQDVVMKPGDSVTVQNYTLKYNGLASTQQPNYQSVQAEIEVSRNGQRLTYLTPSKDFYQNADNPASEVAVYTTPTEDLYLVLSGWDQNQQAAIKVVINPLVVWLWVGGGLMLVGMLISMWPQRVTETEEVALKAEAGEA
jgi:cytochrome c-type biogenesis protein CcmF